MQTAIELLAVVASAVYGVLLARRYGMDFVGVFCMAFVVAFGGGTLRDLFLDRHPLFWIREHHYPVIVFIIAVVTSGIPRIPKRIELALRFPDALALGFFTIAGTDAALGAGTSFFIASLLGTVTGTFGGVIGDVICNRVPSIFRPAPLFATCSFTGAWIYILLSSIPNIQAYAALVAISFIVVFRLAAIRYQWLLPRFADD
ncbi:MAG: trimeric intracellular cation channel family protein [Cyanobacteria bacterium J06626_6]